MTQIHPDTENREWQDHVGAGSWETLIEQEITERTEETRPLFRAFVFNREWTRMDAKRKPGSQCWEKSSMSGSPEGRRRFSLASGRAVAPELPAALHDRAADVWEPRLALADLSAGPWPARARQAATTLSAGAEEHSTVGSLLLDIMTCFYETRADRLLSRQLVKDLNRMGERPWSDLSGSKPITELWLAQRLRPYGVRPATIRWGDNVCRGYVRDDFQEMFKRYVSFAEIQASFGTPETKPPPPTQPESLRIYLRTNLPSESRQRVQPCS
jgi:hypothetical protein